MESKHKSDKCVQRYAQKSLSLAEEDYAGLWDRFQATEQQDIGISSDGLTCDNLQLMVKGDNSDILQATVISVVNTQQGKTEDSMVCFHMETFQNHIWNRYGGRC